MYMESFYSNYSVITFSSNEISRALHFHNTNMPDSLLSTSEHFSGMNWHDYLDTLFTSLIKHIFLSSIYILSSGLISN